MSQRRGATNFDGVIDVDAFARIPAPVQPRAFHRAKMPQAQSPVNPAGKSGRAVDDDAPDDERPHVTGPFSSRLGVAIAAIAAASIGFSAIAEDYKTPATLQEARKGFTTRLQKKLSEKKAPDNPPAGVFNLVRYPAPPGKLAAYVSPDPGDGKRHPLMIWVFGGFADSIYKTAWEPGPPEADQSADAYRKAGILMLYPSFRGGNDNPGFNEGLAGEVDDLLAAADYAASLPYVDPTRLYLGGHSTGGSVSLLAAEMTNRFRAVFAFGPVRDVGVYGALYLPYDITDRRETIARSPGYFLNDIKTPTFVFDGERQPSNIVELRMMKHDSKNPALHFFGIPGANHFSLLRPVNDLIASKIVDDTGPQCDIAITPREVSDLKIPH
jgi:alpha/beta superfamily hydrolase